MKALPSKPDLRKWMTENSTGYRKAAKHFGATEGDLRSIMGVKPSRARAHARTSAARNRVKMGPLEWRNDKLEQLEEAIAALMTAERPSAVGLAALTKSAMKLRDDIDILAAQKGDEFEDMSADEIREYLGTLLEDWPDEHLELAFLVYADRHKGRVLFIAEGGAQSEYDAADGWRDVVEG